MSIRILISVYMLDGEGLCSWELAVNLPFDWSIVSGKRRLRWPMVRISSLLLFHTFILKTDFVFCLSISHAVRAGWRPGCSECDSSSQLSGQRHHGV